MCRIVLDSGTIYIDPKVNSSSVAFGKVCVHIEMSGVDILITIFELPWFIQFVEHYLKQMCHTGVDACLDP